MEFLDTVTDGIDSAVGAVLAPVADRAGAAAAVLRREITQTWHGVFASPTLPGGTNWNGYSHQALYEMVHTDADPGQVGAQSAVLEDLGAGAHQCAEDLRTRGGQVTPESWQGRASGAFAGTIDEHGEGGAAVAEHAAALSAAVLRASEALSRAQAQMPPPVDVAAITAHGALAGGAMAGPNFALGSVAGAGASWFGASLLAANKKAEAVEVMQAFEQSLNAADPPNAPAKVPPGVPAPGDTLPAPRPEVTAVAAPPPTRRATPVPAEGRSAAGTSPSAAAEPVRHRPVQAQTAGSGTSPSAAPVTDRHGGQTHTAPAAARTEHARQAGASPGGRAGWASGPDGRAVGGPVAWRDLVSRGGVPVLLTDEPRPARAAAAGAVPPGGRREDDREHHNRMPRSDKLFTLDDRTPPPVIGA